MKINKSCLDFVQSDNRNAPASDLSTGQPPPWPRLLPGRMGAGKALQGFPALRRNQGISSEAVSARGSSGYPLHDVCGVIYQDSVGSVNISLRLRFCEHGCFWSPITTQAGVLDHLLIGGSEHLTGQFSSVTRSRLRAGVRQRRSQARSVVPPATKPLPLSPEMLLSGKQVTDRL